MKWFRGAKLKPITLLAIITFVVLIITPAKGYAGATGITNAAENAYETTESITRQLDSETVNMQLKRLDLSEAEIAERIGALSDEELHHFASQTENIYPGSGIGSVIIFTIIVLAAAYAYIKVTGKRVVIE